MNSSVEVFSSIFKEKTWGSSESVSGPGSELLQTRNISAELPLLLQDLNARSLLDLPCGDFNWMQHVNLGHIDYIGGDIVPQIVERNQQLYARPLRQFQILDLVDGKLPKVDVVLVRDCLVHLPNSDVFKALRNICNSGALFLLTTNYSFRRFHANEDIAMGSWRRINLELYPFNLPTPVRTIIEGSTESDGRLSDKSLSLWSVAQIKARLPS